MEKRFNYLARLIGVYHKDREWAKKMSEEVVRSIPNEAIVRSKLDRDGATIILKDGSSIQFVFASEHERGHRFSEVFVHKSVGWEEYLHFIKSKLIIAPYSAIMVDEIRDFRFGVRADQWYGLDNRDD